MDADPLPSLRRPDIRDAGVGRARRPKHCISVLEEGLQCGGGGGDAQESAGVRAPVWCMGMVYVWCMYGVWYGLTYPYGGVVKKNGS